jgi:uncharacterized SAM-binding protein YcdF (DUF218 family)
MRLLRTLLILIVLVVVCYYGVLFVAFQTIQNHNSADTHFDTLIVLGNPTRPDGSPAPELRERVDESVREYRAGIAPHVIMSGAAAHNRFVEAQVMADYAAQQGVPRNAIIVEGQAKDTAQNIWYSRQIMQANGWHSAEVISSPYHLPRTGLILKQYTGPFALDWRTHASHWPPEFDLRQKLQKDLHEAILCIRLRWHGFNKSPYIPAT